VSSKSKKIVNNYTPDSQKIPRANVKFSDDTQKISWRFSRVDRDGSWKCSLSSLSEDKVKDVVRKFKEFDSMTWAELKGKDHHNIPVTNISKDARKRLVEIKRDDIDTLFSIRLCGVERIIGVREGDVFNILWWDPFHLVCPSKKKHT
jgi:hypothetical protein